VDGWSFEQQGAGEAMRKLLAVLRVILGILSVLLCCYCGVVFFGTWLMVPSWPDWSITQNLEFRAAMTLGCIAVVVGCVFVMRWCFSGQGSKEINHSVQSGDKR